MSSSSGDKTWRFLTNHTQVLLCIQREPHIRFRDIAQTVGITEGYYLFYAAPYALTLALLIYSSSPTRAFAGAPSELSISR